MCASTLIASTVAVVATATVGGLATQPAIQSAGAHSRALAVNLLLNAGWSWVFFNRRCLAAAVAVNAALTVSSADLARRAIAVRGRRAAWLALYPGWSAFALVLSVHIWLLNRRRRIDVP